VPKSKAPAVGEAFDLIKQKAEAHLQGDKPSLNCLQREYILFSKRDREAFYNGLAADA